MYLTQDFAIGLEKLVYVLSWWGKETGREDNI